MEDNQSREVNNGDQTHRNEESAEIEDKKILRKQRIQRWLCFIVLNVIQMLVFTILGLTLFKIKSAKIIIDSATMSSSSITTTPSPSFAMALNARVLIKNKNMGEFRFDSGIMILTYRGVKVGESEIPSGKVKMRGRWWMNLNIGVDVYSDLLGNHPTLSSDLNSGTLVLKAKATLKGKVSLMKIFKRRKSGKLNCNITIRIAKKVIHNVSCK